jgi:phosphatidyl-myo-inositol dimannoside synthase
VNILALVPEAHGGFGGISVYNRDLIDACCELPRVSKVTLLPRHLLSAPVGVPAKVDVVAAAARGLGSFVYQVARASREPYDVVLCTHLHLLPFAGLAARLRGKPLLAVLYGVEAWEPTGRLLVDRLSRRCDGLIAISDFTKSRFQEWSGVPESRIGVLPNAIHADAFGIGPKPPYLVERYRLAGKKTILTLGRLDAAERQKGIDELIELMAALTAEIPSLVLLVAGDGDDRPRLEAKVAGLGLGQCVRFTGRIAEAEKADHYRLCDVYSMAGRQEGFGFVFLEALATGAPVVASALDGSRDAVLDGALGEVANPDEPHTLKAAILRSLAKPRRVPERLEHFSFGNFVARLDGILQRFVPPADGITTTTKALT